MDAAALSALLSTSTERLSSLHSLIGHPQHALQDALESLHQALKGAVDDQIAKVQQQAEDLKADCTSIETESVQIRQALGDQGPGSSGRSSGGNSIAGPSKRSASGSGHSHMGLSPGMSAEELAKLPLLQRKAQLDSDRKRLHALYSTKEAHCDRLLTKLNSYRPLLGGFVQDMDTNSKPPAEGETADQSGPPPLKDVSHARIASIEAEIIRCSKEVNARSEKLRTLVTDISRLWCDLNLEPCQPIDLGDEEVFADPARAEDKDCGGGTLAFDRAILLHLRIRPAYNEQGKFEGDFVAAEDAADGEDDEGDRTAKEVDILESTPTRASFGGQPARAGGDMILRLPARHQPNTAPPNQLEPTEKNIALAEQKLGWLEKEKVRREAQIQELYDELSELWAKFDVPEEEMDAFVMDNRGSTLDVIEAYHGELEKMRSLKAQHMSLFILKTRERIAALWDSLFMTEEEREASFPSFFIDVSPSEEGTLDEPLPTDEILASHEQMIDYLTEQVQLKAPVLKVMGRYKEVLEDQKQLDEMAADQTRLLGRGARGDPGRLLREEKMRKRVKVQKPRIEAELQKIIPAWEAEHREPFMINGVRYLDELMEQIEGSKENQNGRKRTRSASVAPTPAKTPRAGAPTPGGSVLRSSAQGNRTVAQTPMRHVTPGQSTVKRTRMAPPSASTVPTKTPRTTGGPPTRVATSRIPSSTVRPSYRQAGPATGGRPGTAMSNRNFSGMSEASCSPTRIPLPASPPKTSCRTFGSTTTAGGYGSRVVTGASTASTLGAKVVQTRSQRESFRPRPSTHLRTTASAVAAAPPTVARVAPPAAKAGARVMSPGRASKWGEMGPPRWPVAGGGVAEEDEPMAEAGHREVSVMSTTGSVRSDATTLIHPARVSQSESQPEPAKRYRRAPSMSLETCLANLAASSSTKRKLGEGMKDQGICSIRSIPSSSSLAEEEEAGPEGLSRINSWKDGLRLAGAGLDTDDELLTSETEDQPKMTRSGSSNWELVADDDDMHHQDHHAEHHGYEVAA